jgi:ABC-type phosphate/phosphonate transport system ATPase subunit
MHAVESINVNRLVLKQIGCIFHSFRLQKEIKVFTRVLIYSKIVKKEIFQPHCTIIVYCKNA